MIETLKTLCALFGPSGCEDEVRSYIRAQAEPYADQIIEDANGCLLVFKKGRRTPDKTILLAAHMDEVGVIVKSVTEQGYLKFRFVGGVDRRVVIGKKVFLGEKRIPGVIGRKPIHLMGKDEFKSIPKLETLYIDIGAESKEEAEKLVSVGDYGCFDGSCTQLQNGFLRVKAIDDRVGCAILLETLRRELPVDVWFAFTVQEEIGCRGAFGAAFRIKPDIALIVEGTTAADAPQTKGAQRVCAPGMGPVFPMLDRGTINDPELFALLGEIAAEHGIRWQTKTRVAGGTDARPIQRSNGGCKVCTVSAAIRYIHSPSSVGYIKDFEDMKVIVDGFLNKMEERYG